MSNNFFKINQLLESDKIEDSKKILSYLTDIIFTISLEHQNDKLKFEEEKFGKILCQMIFTKLQNIKQMLDGITYNNQHFKLKKNIIDATLIANSVRNLFETVCVFNNFYISSNSQDEILLKILLWEHSSIKYRLKFESIHHNFEQKKLIDNDKKRLEEIIQLIDNNNFYADLSHKNKSKIASIRKNKDYKFIIKNNNILALDWQGLFNELPDKNKTLSILYTQLSFYSHPSCKSVYDFSISYLEENVWLDQTKSFLRFTHILASVFISDYINYFPKSKSTFNNMDSNGVFLVDMYNNILRGDEYLINKDYYNKF